jgi:predicted dehydrogenase
MDQLKIGVIGYGGHARSHFSMIADEPRLRLEGIAEINAERRESASKEWGSAQIFADYQQMLDSCDLDLVHVITMPGHLQKIVLDCLERGLHTSVEKSPGMNSAETATMAAAAQSSKGKAIVSLNRRYLPQVLAARQAVQERGGAVHCGATYNKPLINMVGPKWAGVAPDPIICDAIHHVDLLRWLAGGSQSEAALAVAVYAEVKDGERPGTHRHNAVIHFGTGAIATMMCHYGVGYRIQRAEVHAEDLSIYMDLTGEPRCEFYDGQQEGRDPQAPLDLEAVGGAGYNEVRHFVDCILEDRTPWSTLDDAVHTMRLCEAIRRGHKGALDTTESS